MTTYLDRVRLLQEQLRAENAVGAVLAGTDQMRYLTGWQEGGHERFVGLLVPAVGEPTFLVPAMNAEQARQAPIGIPQVVGWDDAGGWLAPARRILQSWSGSGATLVDDELHSGHLLALQSLEPHRKFGAAGSVMCRLREIKTTGEIQAMERAAAIIDDVFEEVIVGLASGVTELHVSDCVLAAIRACGSRPSFTPLICFGENSALPHHHTGERRLRSGDVVIMDIGCTADGYASDITRTVAFGDPTDAEAARIYQIVLGAHHAARAAAVPGVSGEEVDSAARSAIEAHGFGPQFLHRTGHGIGLSVHEPPYIVQGNAESLQPGMCFSVEPGIYLPGRFGVRIENIVTMTASGVRSLNAEPSTELRHVPFC